MFLFWRITRAGSAYLAPRQELAMTTAPSVIFNVAKICNLQNLSNHHSTYLLLALRCKTVMLA